MGAAPYGAKAKGADAPARRLRDIRRVHSWARRYDSPPTGRGARLPSRPPRHRVSAMGVSPPDETATLKETVARLIAREIDPVIGSFEARREFARPLIDAMGSAGLIGAAFPERLGGSAMGYRAVAVIAEEVSRLAPASGYAMNVQAMTCPFTIFNGGGDAQIARFVPDLIAGRCIGMFALADPGGGLFPWRDAGDGVAAARRLWTRAAVEVMPGALTARDGPDSDAIGKPYIRLAMVHDLATTTEALEPVADALS